MQLLLRITVCTVLCWQAVTAGIVLTNRFVAQRHITWQARVVADTETRLRASLGADAGLMFALHAAVPANALLLTQKVTGRIEDIKTAADFERLNARNGLLLQLTTLLFPDPFLLAVPEPIPAVEDLVGRGRDAVLCVLPGDRDPASRAGWTRTKDAPGFQIWRFQKD